MKKLLFLAFLMVVPFFSYSQDFDYEISRPYKVIDAHTKEYFYKDGKILAVKIHGKLLTIQTWDAKTMKELSRKEYEDMPKGYTLEKLDEFNNNYYLFYSIWDKKNEVEQLFVRTIDFENGKFQGKGRRLFKVNGKVTNSYAISGVDWMNSWMSFTTKVIDKFNIQKSFDESRILIQYRKKPEVKNDDKSHDIIGFNIFDDVLNEISKEEIKMPYTEAKMNNLDYAIDSKGHMYVLSIVYNDDTQKLKDKKGKINYHLELLRIDANSTELTKTKVKVENIYLNNIALYSQANDLMVCAGFYTKANQSSLMNNENDLFNNDPDANVFVDDYVDGVVIFKVGLEGELSDLQTHEIPLEVLNMYQSKKAQKKNKKKDKKGKAEFAELVMRDIIVDKDGSIVLIGEQHYVIQSVTYSGTKRKTTYTYIYNDILTTKIDKNGDLAWMKKLPKQQIGRQGQGGLSYEYFYNNDSHYLLFMDNIKNIDLSLDKKPKIHHDGAGGFFTAYKINDESGNVEKISLFDIKDVKGMDVFQFQVNRIVQISDTEFVVEVYKKKKEDILIKVKVKE